jgi:hypothetical protein
MLGFVVVAMLCLLTFSYTSAVTITNPVDPNTSMGVWRFSIGEDVNQPIFGCRDRYDGQLVIITASGTPAGLVWSQAASDMNLPASAYPDCNDPQFAKMVNPQVGKGFFKGKLTRPIIDTTVTIYNGSHSETLIIGTVENEPGLSGGCAGNK